MDKKVIIGLIVIILIGAGIWIAIRPIGEIPPIIRPPVVPEIREEIAAHGWSVKDDESQAAKEAVSMMKAKLGRSPDFVFLFSSIGYDEEKLLQEIRHLLPETKIYGGTSFLGVMTNDGFHVGERASLAIMGISSPDIVWGVGSASLDKLSPEEAGKTAVLAAIENAGKERNERPTIIFVTPAPGKEERILDGIMEVVGKDVPIFGGSSGDNELIGKWRQFVNEKVYANGLALAVAYTDLKVGYFYEAGYPVTGQRGTITRGKGRIIYEIDGRPAAKVYNEWAGGAIEEQLRNPGLVAAVVHEATFYPMARVLRIPGREPFYLTIHVFYVRPDHSLEVFANVEEGDEIVLLHGGWDILLDRFRTTPIKALAEFDIEKGEALFALYTYCAGTIVVIPEAKRPKMSLLVEGVIGDVPLIGTFTFGEQGFVPGIGNHHGSLINSIVLFSPK